MMANVIDTSRVPDGRADNGVAAGSDGSANILIIDRDRDCADALHLLLSNLSGVGTIRIARTAADVIGRSLGRSTLNPDLILFDAYHKYASEQALVDTLGALRQRFPSAALVLLCVYPDRFGATSCSIVDRCLGKDTTTRELQELIDDLHVGRHAGPNTRQTAD